MKGRTRRVERQDEGSHQLLKYWRIMTDNSKQHENFSIFGKPFENIGET